MSSLDAFGVDRPDLIAKSKIPPLRMPKKKDLPMESLVDRAARRKKEGDEILQRLNARAAAGEKMKATEPLPAKRWGLWDHVPQGKRS